MLDKFSEELRNAREKKNITLQQMAAKTRIDIKFLEALDNGNFSFLPELYVKAFIRQYAKVVDLDEDECVKKYELAREGKTFESEEKKAEESESPVKEEQKSGNKSNEQTQKKVTTFTDPNAIRASLSSSKTNNSSLTIGFSVIAILAVAAAIYFLVIKKSDTIIVEEKPYEKVLEQQTNQRFIEEPKEEPVVITNLDSLIIEFTNIDSTDSAWIMVIYDESTKGDFLLFPRSSNKIKAAKNIKCTLGNSGVVRIKVNNNPVQFDGKKGSVLHFLIDEKGIERLYSPPTLARD